MRFIPTMVQIPPSIFDREFDTFQSNEMTVINHESEVKQILPICKVSPYFPEISSFEKPLFENTPLDLSLKMNEYV
jgi:hypothetical protein